MKTSDRLPLAALMLFATTLFASASAIADVRILQTNSRDTTVNLIDPATQQVVATIDGIPVSHGVVAAPDGRRIYVSSEAKNSLEVVDSGTLQIIRSIPLSARPNNVTITPDGRKVYVGIIAPPGAIDVIDTATLEKVRSIAVPGLASAFNARTHSEKTLHS